MAKRISQSFFERPVVSVAQDLLGKFLVRKMKGGEAAFRITETEAYDGEDDLACHASRGRTKRTEILYGKPGHFYVYLVYGMHYMLNIVTGPVDYPAAVLIRSVDGISGPGRVTRQLEITLALNGKPSQKESGLWIEDRGEPGDASHIASSPRIGVEYAGPVWAKKPYRFYIQEQK